MVVHAGVWLKVLVATFIVVAKVWNVWDVFRFKLVPR